MADKRRQSYMAIFTLLKNEAIRVGLQLNPRNIMSDFESGLISAVRVYFPTSRHRGCHFHFTQAIYRQVQGMGLVQAYTTQPNIRLQIRQLMALAFLPVAIVRVTFGVLEWQSHQILAPLFGYFRRQ